MTEVATTTETEETVTKTAEVTAEATAQQGEENAEIVNDVNSEQENVEQQQEVEIDLYGDYKPAATSATVDTSDPEKAETAIQSLKDENKALLGKIESLTSELEYLVKVQDHPTIQAARKLIERDGDANVSAFMEVATTSNPRRMSAEKIYEQQMTDFLVKKGFKGEGLTEKLEDALERFSDKDELEKEMTIQSYREKLVNDFDAKTQEFLGISDQSKQQQASVAQANENNFLLLKSEIARLSEQGKFGVFSTDSAWKENALQKLQSVFRFDERLNVDVAHAIKVINYAVNPDAVERELIKIGRSKATPERLVNHAAKAEKDIIADEKKNMSAAKGVFDAMDEVIRKRREPQTKQMSN
jgi:peroxiredoxin